MLPWQPPASLGDNYNNSITPQSPGPYRTNYSQEQNHLPNSNQQQQQSSQQQQQNHLQQQQQNNGGNGLSLQTAAAPQPTPLPPPPPPINLASTIHFLQTEHRRYAKDRNEWEIERAEMRARIALLEGEKRGNEGALRDLGRRCKMLELALRGERTKFLAVTNALSQGHSPSPSGTSSPVQILPANTTTAPLAAPTGIPPSKIAFLKDGSPSPVESIPGGTPSINISGAGAGLGMGSRTSSVNGWVNGDGSKILAGGTSSAGGLSAAGRDPRGKARSRDYLKQCLQEITYLTSATTLNPLSPASFAAPNIPRPRKTLPDHVPVSGPNPIGGIIELNGALRSDQPSVASPSLINSSNSSTSNSISPTSTVVTSLVQYPLALPASVTSFPSDAASAFIPLKRQASQQGRSIGSTAMSGGSGVVTDDTYSRNEWKRDSNLEGPIRNFTSSTTTVLPPAPLSNEEDSSTIPIILPPAPPTTSGLIFIPHSTYLPPPPEEEDLESLDNTNSEPSDHNSNTSTGDNRRAAVGELIFEDEEEENELLKNKRKTIVQGGRTEEEDSEASNRLTAIFRPESTESWAETLTKAGKSTSTTSPLIEASTSLPDLPEKELSSIPIAKRVEGKAGIGEEIESSPQDDKSIESSEEVDDISSNTMWEDAEEEEATKGKEKNVNWKAKKSLRSHLDAVRIVKLGVGEDENDLLLASGSDDMTVKLWRIDRSKLSSSRASSIMTTAEPQITYRGHTAGITSLQVTSSHIYSGSLDGTINIWKIPPKNQDPYAPVDQAIHLPLFALPGSNSSVLDLLLQEVVNDIHQIVFIPVEGGSPTLLKINVAHKSIQHGLFFNCNGGSDIDFKGSPQATSLALDRDGRLIVAYSDSIVKIFDVESRKIVLKLDRGLQGNGSISAQINQVLQHPMSAIIVTAHENRYLRVYDATSGKRRDSILAHLDGITSITFPYPTKFPNLLVSVGHDTSIRFWDLTTMNCIQEISAHRQRKSTEGILSIDSSRVASLIVTGGADGSIKLWGI